MFSFSSLVGLITQAVTRSAIRTETHHHSRQARKQRKNNPIGPLEKMEERCLLSGVHFAAGFEQWVGDPVDVESNSNRDGQTRRVDRHAHARNHHDEPAQSDIGGADAETRHGHGHRADRRGDDLRERPKRGKGRHGHGAGFSLADPLFVINYNDGQTLFPGVNHHETPVSGMNRTMDLRAQVYGATVQSYSWNLSQAPDAGCVIGQDTSRLQFGWNVMSPNNGERLNTITVTATMTDSSTQVQSLSFLVKQDMAMCGGMGNTTTAWPAVLTPDKVLASQHVITSDSPTRPYAVSLESGALYVTHELPAYNPGVPALDLTFTADTAERRPILINRHEIPTTGGIPNTVSARLEFNGTWGPSKYYQTGTGTLFNPASVLQISLQADAGNLTTGRYDYTFETTNNYSGSSTTSTNSGTVTIINEETSPFGEGWTLDLVDRLHVVTGGVILNQGAGASLWFAGSGPNYTTPAGDFSSLTFNTMNSTYTRTLKDGTKQIFNAAGMQTSFVDRNNNTIAFAYIDADSDGSADELSTITDSNGLVTTLAYPGTCGAGVSPARVCTISDPAGRVTSLQYNSSGQLLSITDPDPDGAGPLAAPITQFSYDTASGRMQTYVDPRLNTTSFTSNFAGRITTITRPDNTTEQFKALQLQSLCDAGQCTQGSPGLPLLAAEAVADYTDPRGNAWDYRLDWWGFGTVTQITDPLGQTNPAGHMSVYHRDSNGVLSQSTDRLDRNVTYALDSKGNPTKATLPDLKTQNFQYNTFSQVSQATDELGRVTVNTFDAAGNLTQVTQPDPDGDGPLTSPITTFVNDSQGRRTSVTDTRGYTTNFNYDTRDRVTEIKYPDSDGDPNNNPKVTFVYDTASNVTARTDERNNTTNFTFDNLDRLLTVRNTLGNTTLTATYDAAGNQTTIANALAQTTTFAFNAMNRVTSVTEPDPDGAGPLSPSVTSFTFDAAGNLTSTTDPINRVTTNVYDPLGHRTSTTTPLGFVTTFTVDAEGQITAVEDPIGRTTYAFTNRGLVASTTNPLNQTTSYGYDAAGNRTSMTDPMSYGQGYQYDNLNRPKQYTDQLNKTWTFSFDAAGNRTGATDPLGHTTSYAYDPRGRLISITAPDPDGAGPLQAAVTTQTFDASGNRSGVIDPLGRTTGYTYDAANRRTSITQSDPDGAGPLTSPVTTFQFDAADRLVSLTDPVSNVTSWTFDAAGRVTIETDPLGKTTLYSYNAADELIRITDRRGLRRDFVYDLDGRRTQEKWLDGAGTPIRTFDYTFDAANRLTGVTEPDSTYTFTYDTADRVLTVNNAGTPNMPQVTLTNTYDARGNRTSVADNLPSPGTTYFTFDAANQMTNARLSTGEEVSLGYDAAHRLTSLARRTSMMDLPKTTTSYTYDDAERMTGITHQYVPMMGSPTTLATYTYSHNAASELTSETNADGTFNYSYDATGQLLGVDASGGTCGATACDESFSYDVNGNRTMTGYITGTGNRLTSDGTWNYTFDDNGNTLTKTRISDGQKFEFTWDYRNRLTRVLLKNSAGTVLQESNYTYDAFNRRILVSVDLDGPGAQPPTWTQTIYDGTEFAANPYIDFIDPDGSGPQPSTLNARRLYGPDIDMILARVLSSGTVAWYLTDHLGTVRDIANTSGTVLDHISYSVYGKVTAETNPSNGDRFKFTAREYDSETAQHHYRARVYDATIGRFLSNDPLSFRAGDANLFRYVANAPLNATDPTGELSEPHKPNYGSGDWLDKLAACAGKIGSVACGFIPIVGEVQDWQQVITGKDLWTGEELSGADRVLTACAGFVPFVPGCVAKYGDDVAVGAVKFVGVCFVAGTLVVMAEEDQEAAAAVAAEKHEEAQEGMWDQRWLSLGLAGLAVVAVGSSLRPSKQKRQKAKLARHPVDVVLQNESVVTLLSCVDNDNSLAPYEWSAEAADNPRTERDHVVV